jgi:hypothetical protein
MNVTASKLLLGVSLAAYTYGSWDYLFSSREKPPEPTKGKELTAAVVNHKVELSLGRDPFDSVPLERGAVASGAIAGGGVDDDGEKIRELGEMTLQAIFLMPMERVALVNGKQLHEGQQVQLEPNTPPVRAKKIGEDFVIIEGGGRLVMLRLETGSAADKSAHDSTAAAADRTAPRSGSGAAPPALPARRSSGARDPLASLRPADR